MKNKNEWGFSAVEGLIILLVLVVLGGAGYYIWHNQQNKPAAKAATTTTSSAPTVKTFVACVEAGGELEENNDATVEYCKLSGKQFSEAAGAFKNVSSWSSVTQPQVKLTQAHLSITLPVSAVGSLLYRFDYDSGHVYEFAPKAIIASTKCQDYLEQAKGPGTASGVQIYQTVSGSPAAGQGFNAPESTTISQYYSQHKALDGNYITSTDGAKYWKVGDNFYSVALTHGPVYQGNAFKQACPGVSGTFEKQVADALATLKQTN